jgi:hypothetical protein
LLAGGILCEARGAVADVSVGEEEYDAFCPMEVRPVPGRRVRVGVIVTDLGGEGEGL